MREHRDVKAFFLTWVCYGAWLHGDERGSIDSQHNLVGQPRAILDPVRETVRSKQMKHPPLLLGAKERGVVHRTIEEVAEHRGWLLHAHNVRTNHVHVVVRGEAAPEKILADLKAWSTRRLRKAELLAADRPAWAEGGSTLWLWTDEQVAAKVDYVLNDQGAPLAME